MECPGCGKKVGKSMIFCDYCGQRLRGRFTGPQKVGIMVAIIAADAVAAAFTEFGALVVGIPLTFVVLFILIAYPGWRQTLPSDKWV